MFNLILSAFLYLLGIFCPALSIVAMSSFLIPLLFMKQLSLAHGLIWGCIVFGAHWWWFLVMLHAMNLHPAVYVLYFVLVAWCAAWSGLWLHFFKRHPTCSTVIFFLFISRCSMFLCGAVEGYPLFNPLISLAYYPWTLNWTNYITEPGMLAVLFGFQVALVALLNQKVKAGFILGGFIIALVVGLWLPEIERPDTSKMVPICPWWYKKGDGMFAGYRMARDICSRAQACEVGSILILPESSFCFDIKEYKNFSSIWCDSADGLPILFGAHETENDCGHNAVLLLHNNVFLYRYRKRHFLPVIERSIWIEMLVGKSFVGGELRFPIQKDDSDILMVHEMMMQLFVCSEFFFESKPMSQRPVLLLWNDWWLQCDYAKRLAVLFTVYFEKKYHVAVIHVSTCGLNNLG